ncbi:MAG: UvrD-helicase domain-containing protein [Oscillospiraceae bacterium]|nr:UvrD-helicase domain-containing protein [Oscillospiraceae bacterium]
MEWTNEQQQAIDAKGCALLISAAAGSGKTTVLVEKLAKLICDPDSGVTADSMIVATFTNDAADQMKNKLTKKLEEKLDEILDDPNADERIVLHINDQLALLPLARISTIHSFCFRLIRENAGEIGVDPGFSVVQAADEKILIQRAVQNVLDEKFRNEREKMEKLLSMFFPRDRSSDGLVDMIVRLRNKYFALPFYEVEWQKIIDYYRAGPDKNDGKIYSGYMDILRTTLEDALKLSEKTIEFLDRYRGIMEESYTKKNPAAYVKGIRDKLLTDNDNISTALAQLSEYRMTEIEFMKMTVNTFPCSNESPSSGSDMLKALRDKYRNMVNKYFTTVEVSDKGARTVKPARYSFSENQIAEDYRLHAETLEILFEVLGEAVEEERQLKSEKNVLGFGDAEQLACRLLCENIGGKTVKKSLAQELSSRFGIIMVDEFQDTTKLQELIFKMLSDGGSETVPGRNFFAVGDLKQSIYRFRSAEPGLFKKNLENSVEYYEGCTVPAHIFLNCNFRSSQTVVDYVNSVFLGIMSERFGSVDYGENDMLIHKATDDGTPPPVEILDIPVKKEDRAAEITAAEARAVAKRIADLVKSGVSPSDICVLARNSTRLIKFARELEKYDIRSVCSTKDDLLKTGEVRNIISLLRIIDNPALDISMGAVMMSPLFMFTAEDIARLRIMDSSSSMRANIAVYAENAGNALAERCDRFLKELADLRDYFAVHTIRDGIEYIYDKKDVLSVYSNLSDGDKRAADLMQFLEYAQSFESVPEADLSYFLHTIDSAPAVECAASKGEELVSFKTIHSSKGLEYGYVFLVDTDKDFKDDKEKIYFNSEYGVAFPINIHYPESNSSYSYETMQGIVLREYARRSQRDEELMLLYVALTRAKKGLIMTRYQGKKNILAEYLTEKGVKNDLACDMCKTLAGLLQIGTDLAENVTVTECTEEEETCAEKENTASFDEAMGKIMTANITDDYKYDLSKRSSKLTVTMLSHQNTDEMPLFAHAQTDEEGMERMAPKSFAPHMTAAQRGTAIHSVFEQLDLMKIYHSADREKAVISEKIRLREKLGKDVIRCTDDRMLLDFVSSSLFERICSGCCEENCDKQIFRERQFFIQIDEIADEVEELSGYKDSDGFLQGIADLIFLEDDHYVLVDYKTDRGVDGEMLKERYRMQLYLYRHCFSKILDRPVTECIIYSTEIGEVPVFVK